MKKKLLSLTVTAVFFTIILLPYSCSKTTPDDPEYWADRETEAIDMTKDYRIQITEESYYTIDTKITMVALVVAGNVSGADDFEVKGWHAAHNPSITPSTYTVEFRVEYPTLDLTTTYSFLTDLDTGEVTPNNELGQSILDESVD
jgi:hypothetical protein